MTIKQIVNYLMPYMEKHNYSPHKKRCFYQIVNNLAFCIEFDSPGGLLYATYYIIPLFVPCQGRYYTFGCRFDALKNRPLEVFNMNTNYENFIQWNDNLIDCLEHVVFPFFRQVDSPQKLCSFVDRNMRNMNIFFSCPPIEITRLQLYLYSYLGAHDQAVIAAEKYQHSLKKCIYLTSNVQNERSQEVNILCKIISQGAKALNVHFEKTVLESHKACFG